MSDHYDNIKATTTTLMRAHEERYKEAMDTIARLRAERDDLAKKLSRIVSVGHNNECLFCGFKDKIALARKED